MKIMTVPRLLLLLLLVVINVITAAEEVPKCNYAQLTVYGTILPGDEPCVCGEETICHPHEMCVPYGLAECYAAPCDDLSGRWIWYGRNPRPWTEGDFAVWATVEIEQDDCRFVLTSSSNVGSGGLVSDEIRTRKYYGVLLPLELTSFYLFDTREDMDDYESSSPGDDVEEDGATEVQWYVFTQDFGNGAPEVQCSLYGSLVYKGFTSDALADDADSFDGTLARDVEGSFSVGDTIAADGDWNSNGGGCPEGYPKPWGRDGSSEAKCCDPAAGPGGCPDENMSFDNCWDEGGYCCSDGNWYSDPGDGSGNCRDKQLEDSRACATAEPAFGGCLVGDIVYSEGDSIGHIGLECIDDTTYDGTGSRCGTGGTIVEEELTFACPESVPHCVQCGPRGRGNALCLSTPTTDRDCDEYNNNFETDPVIVCPDGQDPIPDTFCGRGPNRVDCGDGEYCFIHPTDAFAVCCPGNVVEEQPLPTTDRSTGTCTSDNECTATVRSRFPMQSSSGVELCQCYAASSVDPFDECEGETDATCLVAKCANSCDGLEGRCLPSPNSNEGTKMCALSDQSASIPTMDTPSPIANENPTNTPSASSPSPTSDAAVSWQRTAITATIIKLSVTINLVLVLLL